MYGSISDSNQTDICQNNRLVLLIKVQLLFCRFFKSHDREFHVASLTYKPEFKVMPEGWDGTIKDMDEVHYEISKKEDEILYQEFVLRMNFNKMKVSPVCFLLLIRKRN